MTERQRAIILGAIEAQHTIKLTYAKPASKGRRSGSVVTRYVQPYELSVNRAGRRVLWGSCSLHGPKQIHSFRVDRIRRVIASKKPTRFVRVMAVMKHLVTYDYGEAPDRVVTEKRRRA